MVGIGETDHLGEDVSMLLGPVAATDPTPDMPVGGVQDLHIEDRRNCL